MSIGITSHHIPSAGNSEPDEKKSNSLCSFICLSPIVTIRSAGFPLLIYRAVDKEANKRNYHLCFLHFYINYLSFLGINKLIVLEQCLSLYLLANN